MRHPPGQVLHVLDTLQSSPNISSVLALVHKDTHSSQIISALQAAASATLELSPVSPLQRQLAAAAGGPPPSGRLRLAAKRRSGRVRAEAQYYSLAPDGSVTCYAPPAEAAGAPDARSLVKTALAAAPAATAARGLPAGAGTGAGAGAASSSGPPGERGASDELAARLAGGSMRLGLSAEERAERERVVLPFERQRRASATPGAGPALATSGGAGQQQQLGRILYERDSEGEADSDEDPDDDLDV